MRSEAIVDAHSRRMAELDPLVPSADGLPPATADDIEIACEGGVGLARFARTDLDSFVAAWSAAETHRLIARVAGPEGMAVLLSLWGRTVADRATPGVSDSEAVLSWPSRDTAMTPVIRGHGMVPTTVLAVRRRGLPELPVDGLRADVMVRAIEPGDIDVAAELWLAEIEYDGGLQNLPRRDSTERCVRDQLTVTAAASDPWTWVADDGSSVVGVIVVSPPAEAQWVSSMVEAAPIAYVSNLMVAQGHRGRGVGTALARHAHAVLHEGGVAVTALHYGSMNPLSGPFWHRWGYRPLWTSWSRSPARSGIRTRQR